MSDLKTKPSGESVTKFVNAVEDEQLRADCKLLVKMMKEATRKQPKMWGDSIVGFGSYHYKNRSGREGDWFLVGCSPRKRDLTIYIMDGFDNHAAQMKKLGKYRTGKSCLYVKKLADVDLRVLQQIIEKSARTMKKGPKVC